MERVEIKPPEESTISEVSTLRKEWEKLDADRTIMLDIIRDCSALTLPHLVPRQGYTETEELATPFQSIGAKGINNLSSKLFLALFPPNIPFFKLSVDEATMQQISALSEVQKALQAPDDASVRTIVDKGLAENEKIIMSEMEAQSDRARLFLVLKLLVATGNALMYMHKEANKGIKVFKIDQYVCTRDGSGKVKQLIIKEKLSVKTLPDRVKEQFAQEIAHKKESDDIELYTKVEYKEGFYVETQEIFDRQIEGVGGRWREDESPWIVLRWSYVDGDNYGRGIVEEYLGDLRTLEGLRQSIIQYTAVSSKVINLVNPAGIVDVDDLVNANSGDYIPGTPQDVTTLQLDKVVELRVAIETANTVTEELKEAFLLNSTVQRQAERVTTVEINYVAQELETSLGGIYSVLSQELQLPYLKALLTKLKRLGKLSASVVDFDRVHPTITAGIEAIGRGNDFNRINAFMSTLMPLAQSMPSVMDYINVSDLVNKIAVSQGIDTDALVRSDQEVSIIRTQRQQEMQQLQQQTMMQQAMQSATPGVANTLTQGMMAGKTSPDTIRETLSGAIAPQQ